MTTVEHNRLVELLAKQLLEAQRQGKNRIFDKTWRLLHVMGAQVLVQEDGSLLVVTSPR